MSIPCVTYKINPEVERFLCPIILRMEDGSEASYPNGRALADATFDKHYNITSYDVRNGAVVISVAEFFEKNK